MLAVTYERMQQGDELEVCQYLIYIYVQHTYKEYVHVDNPLSVGRVVVVGCGASSEVIFL